MEVARRPARGARSSSLHRQRAGPRPIQEPPRRPIASPLAPSAPPRGGAAAAATRRRARTGRPRSPTRADPRRAPRRRTPARSGPDRLDRSYTPARTWSGAATARSAPRAPGRSTPRTPRPRPRRRRPLERATRAPNPAPLADPRAPAQPPGRSPAGPGCRTNAQRPPRARRRVHDRHRLIERLVPARARK